MNKNQNYSMGRRLAPEIIFVFIYMAVGILAISADSLWIDEFITYRYASVGNIKEMFNVIFDHKASEVQMPFYLTYMWLHEKLFGASEFSLRASSLPLYVIGITTLCMQLRRRLGSHLPAFIVYGMSSFIWYYLNEARPYAMQIGISALILASLLRLGAPDWIQDNPNKCRLSDKHWFYVFCLGVLLLSGFTMLGQIWAGAAILSTFVVIPKERLIGILREQKLALITTFIGLLGIGIYYLWSLTIGARAATIEGPNLFSIIFIFYEMLGLTGTGPGRSELRANGVSAIQPFLIPLVIHTIMIGCIFIAGFVHLLRTKGAKTTLAIATCLSVPAIIILGAGVFYEFRVLGRHFAPLAVILFLVLCYGIKHLAQNRNKFGITLVCLFALFQAMSCLLVRFDDRHKKDDYRLAASIAKQSLNQGASVWWNANPDGAAYYHLPANQSNSEKQFEVLLIPTREELGNKPIPDIIITSKPDIFDPSHTLSDYIKENAYIRTQEIQSFIVWKKSSIEQ